MTTPASLRPADRRSAEDRVARYDWDALAAELDAYGCAVIEKLLTPGECTEIAALYPHEEHFRSHIHMARHGFGKGEYRYFRYPLPDLIAACAPRSIRVSRPSPTTGTSAWASPSATPPTHAEFLKLCHDAGQTRPTPLLLQYVAGRLQLPASGPLRRSRLPDPGGDPALRAGPRLHRRRIRADRAAPAHAEPGRGRAAAPRRCRRLRRPQPSGSGHEGQLPRQPAPWRQPPALRPAPHRRHHLPRREVEPGLVPKPSRILKRWQAGLQPLSGLIPAPKTTPFQRLASRSPRPAILTPSHRKKSSLGGMTLG